MKKQSYTAAAEKALREKALTEIVRNQDIDIETLETRNRDELDFHDIAIWTLKEMLEQAYQAGQNSNK